MVENDQPKILRTIKGLKKGIEIDVTTPSSSTIRKKEHKKHGKYQGFRKELE